MQTADFERKKGVKHVRNPGGEFGLDILVYRFSDGGFREREKNELCICLGFILVLRSDPVHASRFNSVMLFFFLSLLKREIHLRFITCIPTASNKIHHVFELIIAGGGGSIPVTSDK